MATKVTYDRSVGETLRAQLDAISLRVGLDPTTIQQMSPYPNQLSQLWELEEPPYKDEEDDKVKK